MSRIYTNKHGEETSVTDEHLDTAIEIYEELSKASASRRVSWKKHKLMMEEEGFADSDDSEAYRQLIKHERSRRGLLPSVNKHADMVKEGLLQSIRKEIGEIDYRKKVAQDSFTRLNRLKREATRELLLYEAIDKAIENADIGSNKLPDFKPINDSYGNNVMLISWNDVHYGYDVPEYYTPEIAKFIINDYADKVVELIRKENIYRVIVANEGDSIEGRLRSQSIADGNLSSVDQAVEVADLYISFVEKLSEYCYVDTIEIAGNHDRLTESKNDNLEGQSFVPIITKITEKHFKDNDRVCVLKTESVYYHIINIKGYNVFLAHGDRHSVKSDSLLAELSVNYKTPIDIVIVGHVHHFKMLEVSNDKYVITTGSIKGNDAYSEQINKQASRSQVAIIFKDSGFDVRQVKL